MSYAETIVPEFDHEMANTRKVLERVPDEKMDWRPTPTSQTIGWNASHLAAIPTWGTIILSREDFDLATAERPARHAPADPGDLRQERGGPAPGPDDGHR